MAMDIWILDILDIIDIFILDVCFGHKYDFDTAVHRIPKSTLHFK